MLKFALFLFVTMLSCAAAANDYSGDLFSNSYYISTNRPWVPSDQSHGSDLFRAPPPLSQKADVFAHTRPQYGYSSGDLFHPRFQAPYPYQPMFQPPR